MRNKNRDQVKEIFESADRRVRLETNSLLARVRNRRRHRALIWSRGVALGGCAAVALASFVWWGNAKQDLEQNLVINQSIEEIDLGFAELNRVAFELRDLEQKLEESEQTVKQLLDQRGSQLEILREERITRNGIEIPDRLGISFSVFGDGNG